MQQVEIPLCAARLAELHIARPRARTVALHLIVQAERADLRQRVIDIVERIQEDVLLLHPEPAALKERVAVVVPPRHVFLLERAPDAAALRGRHVRLRVDFVLEFIDADDVRQACERVAQVRIAVFVRPRAEELIHPRVGEEFHRHRVDLVDLACGALQHGHRDQPLAEVALERVAGLVGQHIDVRRGAVEIGKDERRLIRGQRGAVAAEVLARPRFEVEQRMLRHEVEEFLRLRGKRAVHFGRGAQHVVLSADRVRVAAREHEAFVVIPELVDAEPLGLRLKHAGDRRRDDRADLLAELFNVLRRIIEPLAVAVGQRRVALEAELFRHGRAHRDELVVNRVELCGSVRIKRRPLFKGLAALRAVRAFHVLQEPVEVAGFAAELRFAGRGRLRVGDRKLRFADEIANDARILHEEAVLQQPDEMRAVLAFKIRAERAVHDRFGEGLRHRDQRRQVFVEVRDLGVVKRVGRIHCVADARDGLRRAELRFERLRLPERLARLRVGLRAAERFPKRLVLLDRRRDVRARVGQLAEFLHHTASFLCLFGTFLIRLNRSADQ